METHTIEGEQLLARVGGLLADVGTIVAQVGTLFYFGFFLLMPWWSRLGEPKTVPDRITFAAH